MPHELVGGQLDGEQTAGSCVLNEKRVHRCNVLNHFLKTKTVRSDDWIRGFLKTKAYKELQMACYE